MNYIVKALIPEIPNSRKGLTKTFHLVSNLAAEVGIVVSGLTTDVMTKDALSTNDLVILHNAQPVAAFVSGMSKAFGIPTIGYASTSRVVAVRDYVYICDKIVEGSENLKKVLEYFLKEGFLP